MIGLSPRQRIVLGLIFESIRDRGFAPSIREIGNRMGISSTNGVNDHLRALERKGYIRRTELLSRSIVLTDRAFDELGVMRDEPATAKPIVRVNPAATGIADIKDELSRRGFSVVETSAIPLDVVEFCA